VSLPVSSASCSSDALSAQGLTFFATTILARLFVALLELQALEQPVVLNFFLQNAHGLFKIVVEDSDFNCFQTASTPFFPITSIHGTAVQTLMVILITAKYFPYQIGRPISTKNGDAVERLRRFLG
jgi:hypothetical protein